MFRYANPTCSYLLGFGRKLLFFRVHQTVDGFIESEAKEVTDIIATTSRKHVWRSGAICNGGINSMIVAKDIQHERK